VAVDALATDARPAEPGEVKRLGKQRIVVALTLDGGARIEVATSVDGRDGVVGPFAAPSARRRG